jgi:hypothetical protein
MKKNLSFLSLCFLVLKYLVNSQWENQENEEAETTFPVALPLANWQITKTSPLKVKNCINKKKERL